MTRVRSLDRVLENTSLVPLGGPSLSVICSPNKPTFRRLFSHATWRIHLGGTALQRWWRVVCATRRSVILRSTLPSVLCVAAYALGVGYLMPRNFGRELLAEQQLPLGLCGSAIGLLLVFRTNSAYARLDDARATWANIVPRCQSLAARFAAARVRGDAGPGPAAAAAVCRYLSAFGWSLRDLLRDGDERDDILKILIEDPAEEAWIASSPNRPAALLHRLRSLVAREHAAGRLDSDEKFLCDGDIAKLLEDMGVCLRIFTSPIPPTMSRHGIRSLTLWLLALPVVMAGSLPAGVVAAWTATTAFVYLGIDELGVQVEQPFTLMPLWQLCQGLQDGVLATLDSPEAPLFHPRDSYVY